MIIGIDPGCTGSIVVMTEHRKNYWLVTVEGFPPFTMAGEKMTKEEAMHAVHLVWPGMRVSVK